MRATSRCCRRPSSRASRSRRPTTRPAVRRAPPRPHGAGGTRGCRKLSPRGAACCICRELSRVQAPRAPGPPRAWTSRRFLGICGKQRRRQTQSFGGTTARSGGRTRTWRSRSTPSRWRWSWSRPSAAASTPPTSSPWWACGRNSPTPTKSRVCARSCWTRQGCCPRCSRASSTATCARWKRRWSRCGSSTRGAAPATPRGLSSCWEASPSRGCARSNSSPRPRRASPRPSCRALSGRGKGRWLPSRPTAPRAQRRASPRSLPRPTKPP
mmetsp:Transcript_70545/g.223516  ORF Transcript_70545/g.223516 Transcript_70545/m.223516 type:complete len:269 (-) Transcript_70545:454-1260(-)